MSNLPPRNPAEPQTAKGSYMRTFVVAFSDFYGAFPPHSGGDMTPEKNEAVRTAIGQLVARYGIARKSILSIGSSSAFEEYWFAILGLNRLTLVDIDEHDRLLPALEKMPRRWRGLSYHIGDAAEFCAPRRMFGVEVPRRRFDVLYLSSFTPDEIRRDTLLRERSEALITRKMAAGVEIDQWAPWQDPLHPVTMEAAHLLRPGGLMIVQSYAFGIDAVYHKYFLPAMHRQLEAAGIELLEVHRFQRTTGVNLIAAQKRGGHRPPMEAPISRFHARATPEPVERIWPRS